MIYRFCCTIVQFILLFGNSKQLHSKQAITTIKTISKTIKSPLFKQIGNTIKKPIVKAFDNTIKNSVSKFRRNKNATKSFACGIQEKNFGMQYNFGSKYVKYLGDEGIKKFKYMAPQAIRRNKQLVRTRGKKNMWMRSAGWMKGKEIRSLINMVSKSKPQLPLLLVAGSLGKLTKFSLVPEDNDLDLTETDYKDVEEVEYYREKYQGQEDETNDEIIRRMYDKHAELQIETANVMKDIVKLKNLYNKSSSTFYGDDLIGNSFITKEKTTELSINKNPEELQSTMKFPVDLDKVLSNNPGKRNCPVCRYSKKIKFYCTQCDNCILKEHELPEVKLPIDIHIVKHIKEHINKCSVYPLIFLSEKFKLTEQPGKFQWGNVKELEMSKPGHNYVLYPHKNARLIKEQPKEEQGSIKSIKVIDCYWGQTQALMKNVPENTKFIKQEDYESTFWRYHWHGSKCLSSAEATYYQLKEYDQAYSKLFETDANETLDSVLFFYFLQYKQLKKDVFNKNHKKYEKYFDQIEKFSKIEKEAQQKKLCFNNK